MTVGSTSSIDIEDEAAHILADKNAMSSSSATSNGDVDMGISEEEEARLAIDNLKGDDVEERIAAANKLDIVAKILGEERTRMELLPFIEDRIDDEDDVLAAVASSLGKLVPLVGGPYHVRSLLVPLEMLLSVEETTVRENAQKSALAVSEALPSDHFHSEYTEMITRLAKKEWFTARISACVLIANSFHSFSDSNQEIKANDFAELCRDEVAMVRRAAAQNLGVMVLNIVQVRGVQSVGPGGMLSTTFIPLYEALASNEQPDSVRLHTTENCIAFGKGMSFLKQEKLKDTLSIEAANLLLKKIVPLIAATIEDRSWRVRWTAASKFANVINAFKDVDDDFTIDLLISSYEKLLQDPEAEVKTAAILNLAEVATCKSKVPPSQSNTTPRASSDGFKLPRISIAKRLVKKIQSLTEDDSNNVRAAVAMVASDLAPLLGKEATISDLVPQILLLLRDSTSEVRLNVISSLGSLNEVIGVGLLSQSLLPAILDLATDSKWRIRLATMQHMPLLAKQLGTEFFTEKIVKLCVGWLGDDISTIRMAAAENLKELTNIFGSEWAIEYLLPPLEDIQGHRSYLRRLTAAQAFVSMSTVMEPDFVQTEILPLLLLMATDVVANVRFNVAKGLKTLAPICGHGVTDTQIRPILSMLIDDSDCDVRFFATKTLESLDSE
mmetsp:Transcript_15627/g.29478  ORF Transcript_15627/g.29478 Transcript_15627/m.29478 type:complete len:669 (+) Transcript_15627:150-2156(+)|eukprot:CAMPEP_0176497678 /NCGR_PEP_ID=MMETSP0200_2-20121128/11859_1 /TAXON_ID=947934 /ORGANISM="Chaetoceros sp., Strain GSL56" /LENGTH=668 /DNA_ID=CAMNT_0017895721 /DNA_START=87 /DNA_END=2093 /DNA_ORIENTATION=+